MKTFLKIKGLSLAAETRIIKKLEQNKRVNVKLRENIHNHRVNVVRPEARSTHLALGFLRGRDYKVMEVTSYHRPNWARIEQLIKKYGLVYFENEQALLQKFAEWRDNALNHYLEGDHV